MKIDFKILIDEENDTTAYEIWSDGRLFAEIGGHDSDCIEFHPVALDMNFADRMRVLTAAWQHWDALDSWSDVSFELTLS